MRIDPKVAFEKHISDMSNLQLFYLLQFVTKELYRRLEPAHAEKLDHDAKIIEQTLSVIENATGKELG